jgi:hypothetical protein
MNNIYLFQPQYSIEFRDEKNYYLPHSSGCLWSYVAQYDDIKENFALKEIIFKREPVEDVIARMDNPVYCGFSCYIWNERYCLAAAELIKQRWPKCVIQFGGPQAQSSMTRYKFIDSFVIGEGEEIFLTTLRTILKGQAPDLFYAKKRLEDLEIPSPYLTGVFDQIVADHPNVIWAMSLETNRGCPYSCTFCDWGGITYSKVKKFNLEKVAAELDWARRHRVVYMFLADANFGIFKERDLEIAKMIRYTIDNSEIEAVNIQYAKNSTDVVFEIAKTIGPHSRGITVSVQSMNDLTLDAIKRKNLDVNNIRYMMEMSQQHDVITYTEVIVGLPHETKESWIAGLGEILEIGQHQNIDVWFAQLLGNSELASEQSRREHQITTVMAKDFMSIQTTKGDADIQEYSEVINSTRTMATEDIVECYLFAWMIIHFHINGYSQVVARYARTVKNISYQTFYTEFFKNIEKDSVLGPHFVNLRNILNIYLTTGDVPENFVGGHALHTMSYKFVYDNRLAASRVAVETLSTLVEIDPEVHQIQNAFIVDSGAEYPQVIEADYDVFTGHRSPYRYTFNPKVKELPLDDFYTRRRKGLIKNELELESNG